MDRDSNLKMLWVGRAALPTRSLLTHQDCECGKVDRPFEQQ
jgi:hypothetical protein